MYHVARSIVELAAGVGEGGVGVGPPGSELGPAAIDLGLAGGGALRPVGELGTGAGELGAGRRALLRELLASGLDAALPALRVGAGGVEPPLAGIDLGERGGEGGLREDGVGKHPGGPVHAGQLAAQVGQRPADAREGLRAEAIDS